RRLLRVRRHGAQGAGRRRGRGARRAGRGAGRAPDRRLRRAGAAPDPAAAAGQGRLAERRSAARLLDPVRNASAVPRYRLTLEYDGAGFVGWQRQANGPSVQQALEEAIEAFCSERTVVHGAGRTDSGVHALGQVAHLDLEGEVAPARLRDALNFHLKPRPAAVLEAALAPAGFHARFSALERRYRYRIVNRRAPLVLERGRAWRVPQPLDETAMQAAADRLVGHHD